SPSALWAYGCVSSLGRIGPRSRRGKNSGKRGTVEPLGRNGTSRGRGSATVDPIGPKCVRACHEEGDWTRKSRNVSHAARRTGRRDRRPTVQLRFRRRNREAGTSGVLTR